MATKANARKAPSPKPKKEEVAEIDDEEDIIEEDAKKQPRAKKAVGPRVFIVVKEKLECVEGPDVLGDEAIESLFTTKFTCPTPSAAAKKAFGKIVRIVSPSKKEPEKVAPDHMEYIVYVLDTTSKKEKNEFPYIITRTKLDTPSAVTKGGEDEDGKKKGFYSNYATKIKAYNPSKDEPSTTKEPAVIPAKTVEKKVVPKAPVKSAPTKAAAEKVVATPAAKPTPSKPTPAKPTPAAAKAVAPKPTPPAAKPAAKPSPASAKVPISKAVAPKPALASAPKAAPTKPAPAAAKKPVPLTKPSPLAKRQTSKA